MPDAGAPGRRRKTSRASRHDDLEVAVDLLTTAVERRLVGALSGRRSEGRLPAEIDLALRVPLRPNQQRMVRAARELEREIAKVVDDVVASVSLIRPGRVPCLRCGTSDCEHSAPGRAVEVFAGYGPSGTPRFVELAQLVLERRPELTDALYSGKPGLATMVLLEEELRERLLPAFSEGQAVRLHGQVVAGYWEVRSLGERALAGAASSRLARLGRSRDGEAMAVTFQIVSSRSGARGMRLELNPIVATPAGEPFEIVVDRFGEAPWRAAVEWASRAVRDIERGARSGGAENGARLEQRLRGVLDGLERRLRRLQKNEKRRTHHAAERQRQRRPVNKALDDLEAAHSGTDVLWDRAKKTVIVLGARGRVHVFNPSGKLVTSVHYPQDVIARRRRSGRWAVAKPNVVEGLRSAVAHAPEP